MPLYSLTCRRCGYSFEKQASIRERGEKAIPCPECGGTDLDADYSSGKSAALKKETAKASACPHSAGCGCCGCRGGNR